MPSSKPAFFFSATQSVDDRLGDVFSFIWASYAGLRELWWQVRGFQSQFPDLHIKRVEEKFLSGLPVPWGIDFRHLFLDTNWGTHEEEFAKWLLFETCTLYEGWAEKVCGDVFAVGSEQHAKQLQFPSGTSRNGQPTGFLVTVRAANRSTSSLMQNEFFPRLASSKLNVWPSLEHYLAAYRYFKECRNSIIHSGGLVTQEVVDWRARLSTAQSLQPAPFRHLFVLPMQPLGDKICMDLGDCTLFATLVRKVICTLDAALCVTETSEQILEQRLKLLLISNKAPQAPGHPPTRR
ncbi:hypothetical protein H6G65_17610 [Microcystis elabens FACHB-917]|nr:hypothetical protein [Microcystis elabens FACHB-917]